MKCHISLIQLLDFISSNFYIILIEIIFIIPQWRCLANENKLYDNILQCQKLEKIYIDPESTFTRTDYRNGIIQSPSFPQKYPRNEQCIFTIHGK